jgi:hypothetical protein
MAGCGDDDPTPARQLDGGLDGGDRSCGAERAFVLSHRACSTDDDCVIVGACSGGWGFEAVQRSAQAEAQRWSDDTQCKVFDGPLYNAVCERAVCVARQNGAMCGMPSNADGGAQVCAAGEELYTLSCDAGTPACAKRCDGAADLSCGAAKTCAQTSVAPLGGYGAGCTGALDVWLCR